MKETEKIEIMHFDQEGYLEDGKALYETGKKMTALADKVADEGYDAVFLMGVGGTWDELMQLEYLMNKFGDRDLEVYLIHAAEWNAMGHKRMTEKSVVLTASESGTTPEVLEAVKKMKDMGIRVYAMTKPEGPIGQAVGANRKDMAKRFAWLCTGLGMGVMALSGVGLWIFAPTLMSLFTTDAAVIALGAQVLRIEAWAEPMFGASIVASGAMQGAGDSTSCFVLNIFSMWCIRLTLAFLLAPRLGLMGVWGAMCCELSIRGLLFLIRLARGKWLEKGALS